MFDHYIYFLSFLALALCDWSWLQETRRKIARMYCSPKVCSSNYELLDSIASDELEVFLESLAAVTVHDSECEVQVKQPLLMACANMFTRFMCSAQFDYGDHEFQTMVRTFDEIFWDINQGYAMDFLPWLRPFYIGHMRKLSMWSTYIRRFMMNKIVSKRSSYTKAMSAEIDNGYKSRDDDEEEPTDFTDALLINLRKEPRLKMHHVLFELEDFIGGHSAVGNMVMIALSMVATRPHVAQAIRNEAQQVTGGQRLVRLYDKPDMPYTEATLFETLRVISSPIVPHVATEDTTIKGEENDSLEKIEWYLTDNLKIWKYTILCHGGNLTCLLKSYECVCVLMSDDIWHKWTVNQNQINIEKIVCIDLYSMIS